MPKIDNGNTGPAYRSSRDGGARVKKAMEGEVDHPDFGLDTEVVIPSVKFSHLHVHSDASLKDGLGTINHLVQTAKKRGFNALALTDHGTLANSISFSLECELAGIKPVIGMEAYIEFDGEVGHMTLLANGDLGFNSLVSLNNIGHASERSKPAFSIDDLIKHNQGLILLSGCVASPLNRLSYGEAKTLATKLRLVFGKRFYSEAMFVADLDTWSRPLQLAKDLHIPVVITNDAHFASQEDGNIHPILTKMKAGFEYNSTELWLKRPEDIFPRVNGAMSRDEFKAATEKAFNIANQINKVSFKRTPSLPHIPNARSKLRRLAFDALDVMSLSDTQYLKRTKYELLIIEKMNYSSYFLILKDIIDHARENKVRVGPGRGSGAGSLLLFLLGATTIDPILYDLPFERFLNPEREGMPDVDTDFDSEHRQIVIDYAAKRWNASQIATYAHYNHKILVHDLCKMYHVDQDLEKLAADKGPESDEFYQILKTTPQFGQAYELISGQIRHKGKHAGGVIITDLNVPIERAGDTLVAAWVEGDHNELSYAGVVKFDLLGLSVLSALNRLEKKFHRKAELPVAKHPVFSVFRDGNLAGIFQFAGSPGIKELTIKMQPTEFADLVAINALYRPGSLDSGTTGRYPEYKKNPRKIHPLIDDILVSTYGAIIYQEQVMSIFARIMGGTLGQADLARRVIVKSKPDDPVWVNQLEELRSVFLEGCEKQKLELKTAHLIWSEIATHARYSFNKAHCVSYSMIAWETAWWKHYYPASFYCEMLNTDPSEAQTYIMEAVQNGIKIVPPHVNFSTNEYVTDADETSIFIPLSQIKQLSPNSANCIMEARNAGEFVSLEDFMSRCPRRIVRGGAREGLWQLGSFAEIPGSVLSLGIKNEITSLDDDNFVIQQKYLGTIIPTKKLLLQIEEQKRLGKLMGVITTKERKESKYGPYIVYKMAPEGVFWVRDGDEQEIGQLVKVTLNGKSGRAKSVEILRG